VVEGKNRGAALSTTTIKIGLCGLGTVGQGVWKHLERTSKELGARLGMPVEVSRVAVRDLKN
jgi:homoserine dehydrogenase